MTTADVATVDAEGATTTRSVLIGTAQVVGASVLGLIHLLVAVAGPQDEDTVLGIVVHVWTRSFMADAVFVALTLVPLVITWRWAPRRTWLVLPVNATGMCLAFMLSAGLMVPLYLGQAMAPHEAWGIAVTWGWAGILWGTAWPVLALRWR